MSIVESQIDPIKWDDVVINESDDDELIYVNGGILFL